MASSSGVKHRTPDSKYCVEKRSQPATTRQKGAFTEEAKQKAEG